MGLPDVRAELVFRKQQEVLEKVLEITTEMRDDLSLSSSSNEDKLNYVTVGITGIIEELMKEIQYVRVHNNVLFDYEDRLENKYKELQKENKHLHRKIINQERLKNQILEKDKVIKELELQLSKMQNEKDKLLSDIKMNKVQETNRKAEIEYKELTSYLNQLSKDYEQAQQDAHEAAYKKIIASREMPRPKEYKTKNQQLDWVEIAKDLYENGLTYDDICSKYDIKSPALVRYFLKKKGLFRYRNKRPDMMDASFLSSNNITKNN